VKGDGCEQFKILLSLCKFQTTRHAPRVKLKKIKKIKLNQNFKPTLHHKQKVKAGGTLVAKKTQLIKTFEDVDFLTQSHKRYFPRACLCHERITPKIS
jgi:hypothetical protein